MVSLRRRTLQRERGRESEKTERERACARAREREWLLSFIHLYPQRGYQVLLNYTFKEATKFHSTIPAKNICRARPPGLNKEREVSDSHPVHSAAVAPGLPILARTDRTADPSPTPTTWSSTEPVLGMFVVAAAPG